MSSPQGGTIGPQGIETLPLRDGNALRYLRVTSDGIGLEWVEVTGTGIVTSSNTVVDSSTQKGLAKAKVIDDLPFKVIQIASNKLSISTDVSNVTLDVNQSNLTLTESQITNLTTDLSNKSSVGHTHTESEITNLVTDLASKYSATNRQTLIINSEISTVDTGKITTGTMSTARLASGTADATTFLRGDSTWAIPAGSGGGAANIKQIEVDFGVTPISEQTFTITDAEALISSQLMATLAYEAPTGKELDELELDDSFSIICAPAAGSFNMKIHSIDGTYLHDKFKINYLIG